MANSTLTTRSESAAQLWAIALLILLSVPYLMFTLEDTWIFLALAKEPFHLGSLKGATSAVWGLLTVLIQSLRGDSDATWALKIASAVCWVSAGALTISAVAKWQPASSKVWTALIFGLMTSTIWSWSGMDSALSMVWAGLILHALIAANKSGGIKADVVLVLLLGSCYLIRPELAWIGPLWLLWVRRYRALSVWLFYAAALSCLMFLAIFFYWLLTGSFTPSSAVKIGFPGIVSAVSLAWFVIQILPLVWLYVRNFRFFADAVDSIVTFCALLIGLRLIEHLVLGGIDHRTLSMLSPWVVFIWGASAQKNATKVQYAILLIPLSALYLLNTVNAYWYAERTETVHKPLLTDIALLPTDYRIGTEEVGLLAYRFGVDRVLDYHRLIGVGLGEGSDAQALIFTGGLYRESALKLGFRAVKTECYQHLPTLMIRSVGLTPSSYCKTLYLR